ncbi:MAG: acetyltransferase [Prevotellaceae bacterium]|nr:acetyltransferase [Prevotellaceae bacterium]
MYLYGASGHAKVIIEILEAAGERIDALIDDNPALNEVCGYPVRHDAAGCSPLIISIGANAVRRRIAATLNARYGTAVHPSAVVSPRAVIGVGTVVMQGAVLQTSVRVGRHCIVNTGVSVDHECRLGDYVHLSPHATLCGNVQIDEGTWVGAGAIVVQGVHIGRWSVIGAGSVVTKDIPDGVVAYGNPCRVVRYIREGLPGENFSEEVK